MQTTAEWSRNLAVEVRLGRNLSNRMRQVRLLVLCRNSPSGGESRWWCRRARSVSCRLSFSNAPEPAGALQYSVDSHRWGYLPHD